jgi:hypothetical protein
MIIWMHTHNITTTNSLPDVVELVEILDDDVSVKGMPPHNGGHCKTFQTACHIHAIHMYEVLEHLQML